MGRPSTKGFFIGKRLTEAREARSWTQKQLAITLGRSESTISKWEKGEQYPEPKSLDELADALSVFSGYFLRPMPDHGPSPIFFRSLANATARARTREKARVRWLQLISLSLQEVLEFPPVDVPELVEPGCYARLCVDDLERLAQTMRLYWGLGESPIQDMLLIVENAGIVVGVDDVGSRSIDGQGTWSDADGRPYILLACDKYTSFRRQTDTAHELAHLVLHRGISNEELARNFNLIESQAKYLAGAFLLPHRSFSAEIGSLSLDGFLALKLRWKVAVGAMIKRAHQLEILSDDLAQRLWKYRATRGWHRREPYDLPDETPVPEPKLLRRSVEMIVSHNVRSKRDLLEIDIGLGASDVERLASLDPGYFAEMPRNVVRIEPRLRALADMEPASVVPFRRPG